MQDKRSKPSRAKDLPLLLLTAAALPFTVSVYSVCEIYANNREEFAFALSDFFWVSLLIALGAFVVLASVLLFTKGKARAVAFALELWLSVMFYLQGSFLNFGFSSLVADELEQMASPVLIAVDILVWIAVGVAFVWVALKVKDKSLIKSLSMILVVMIVGVQVINMTVSLVTVSPKERSKSVLTTEGLFELSENGDNVVIFLLDRFDIHYYDRVVAADLDFFEGLDGFTFYDNNISLYSRTYPAVTYMLTGVENDFSGIRTAYFKKAYGESAFLHDLKKNDYRVTIYSDAYYVYDDAEVLSGIADNVSRYDDYLIRNRGMLALKMNLLSLSRYLPLPMKGLVRIGSSDFSGHVVSDTDNDYPQYILNDSETYRALRETGVQAVKGQNGTFTFIHLSGCHSPYTMDEQGNAIPSNNTAAAAIPALRGCFGMIYEYIEQMKALGLYEDATIIITGDHARAMDDTVDVEGARVTALFVKEKGDAGSPLTYSSAPVCQANLWAQIVKSAGLATDVDYGLAFSEIEENSSLTRQYRFQKSSDDGDEIVIYEVVGDAKNFENWTLVDRKVVGKIYK